MIDKQREKTIESCQLEALDRRLIQHHPSKELIQGNYKRIKRGIRGEKEVDYPLSFLNEQRYLILHILRLQDQNGFFQIDTLILCERYILILEVKNWYGTLLFDEIGQVIRIGDDQMEEGFPNPISQVKMQQHRLQRWLNTHGLHNIPLEFFVVISFPSTIIKTTSPNTTIPKAVIHNNQLFFKIQDLDTIYSNSIMKVDELSTLSKQLIKAHTPANECILDKYNLYKNDLIKGVLCPNCTTASMIRKNKKWLCTTCNQTSLDTHLAALNDYKLLISDKISNSEARDFLQIQSPYVVKRLLQKHFKCTGNTKDRVYFL